MLQFLSRVFRRKPAPEPLDLTPYQGQWVAVHEGKLLGYAPTASEMMYVILNQSGAWKGCTIWHVASAKAVEVEA
jgi:hypothetical protein